jgi:uncharacterized membrane protein
VNYLPLAGILVVVAGFALRVNPIAVVVSAAIATGLAAGMTPPEVLSALGTAFVRNRLLLVWVFTLPVIGLLEREGLRSRAEEWIRGLRSASPGRVLILYHLVRQIAAAIGLNSLGGHPQTVRPLVAPLAEAAAEKIDPQIDDGERQRIRAMAAATDNVALFFGEDIFIAFGAVLLIQGVLRSNGIEVEALHISLWGIPTGVAASAIHLWRLRRLDVRTRARARERPAPPSNDEDVRVEKNA